MAMATPASAAMEPSGGLDVASLGALPAELLQVRADAYADVTRRRQAAGLGPLPGSNSFGS